MDDEWLMRHFETEHPEDLSMEFRPRPGKINRELAAPKAWRTYHETLHRLWPEKYDHNHEEAEVPIEKIYLLRDAGEAYVSQSAARGRGLGEPDLIELHRPDLRPIYGGPTLLEALWSEMDTIMERLMTGQASGEDVCGRTGHHGVPAAYDDFSAPCEHEDNGDKYRAQELAWVLAIVTDPYEPSVDKIRAETMARWTAMQQAAEEVAAEQQATIQEGYGL